MFAPKILADAGIRVVMKVGPFPFRHLEQRLTPFLQSDDAGRSRYLTDDAVQAHYYGLEAHLALSSIISTPAEVLGKGHRIGYLRTGYDAGLSRLGSLMALPLVQADSSPFSFESDVVIWQSHPLQLGATPSQVYVDGIPQLKNPHLVARSDHDQELPPSADFAKEIAEVISTHGDPSFEPKSRVEGVVFTNVSSVILRDGGKLKELLGEARSASERETDVVVVSDGVVVCVGSCAASLLAGKVMVDLKGGSLQPGLTAFG